MLRKTWVGPLASVVLLALAGGWSALEAQEPQEVPSAAGHWEGAILVPDGELGINVDLSLGENGIWVGDISIPLQATEDFPLARVTVQGRQVSFAMAEVPGDPTFRGTLSEDGRTITGTFTQGGQSLDFRLTRSPA